KHVTGYDTKYPRQDRERVEHFSSGIINPAGGMSSNVTNLAKFFQAHMYGDQSLLPDDLKKEMQSTQFEHNNERRGLGFWLGQVPNGPSIAYHMGGYPGFRSCSAVYQEDKMAIIVLTNAYDGPATNWLMAIKSILDVYVVHWDEFTIDNLEQKPDFSELIGYYRTSGAISHFTQIGDRLVSILPGSSNPLQSLIIYDYLGDLTFLSPTESAFAKIGEEIHFVQGESGEKILLESDNSKAPKFNLDEY
ncbi:MAG: beta-lactamase family protein, partial [Candidatus Heimdallarchaeota archaeon]|nr:beta-lactamase family protein [Candidatus Heimdallarchaeota archaeon]